MSTACVQHRQRAMCILFPLAVERGRGAIGTARDSCGVTRPGIARVEARKLLVEVICSNAGAKSCGERRVLAAHLCFEAVSTYKYLCGHHRYRGNHSSGRSPHVAM
eukprot:151341-Prymnesium_polylepis.3